MIVFGQLKNESCFFKGGVSVMFLGFSFSFSFSFFHFFLLHNNDALHFESIQWDAEEEAIGAAAAAVIAATATATATARTAAAVITTHVGVAVTPGTASALL